MENLDDSLLRIIFNYLDPKYIKNISIVCKNFNHFKYTYQCIPIGIYEYIYGFKNIDDKHRLLNKYILKNEYTFIQYIKDIIMFLDDITVHIDAYPHKPSKFIYSRKVDNKYVLYHSIYRVSVFDYYNSVYTSRNLRGLIY